MFLFLFKVLKWHRDITRNIFFNIRWWMCHSQIWMTLYIRIQKTFLNLFAILLLLFTNGCYRNDADKIRHDLEIDCHKVSSHIWPISAWWKPVTIYPVKTFLFLRLILPYTHISYSQFANVMSNLQILALKFQLLLFWLNCIWFELFIDRLINSYVLLWIKLIFFK